MVTFDQLSYSYLENASSDMVVVCVDLMDNAVTRTVDIHLTLRDGTAVGESSQRSKVMYQLVVMYDHSSPSW